jgi:hypothetical protein
MKLQAKNKNGATYIFDIKEMSEIEDGFFYLKTNPQLFLLESTLKAAPKEHAVNELSFAIRSKLAPISHAIQHINANKSRNCVLGNIEQQWLLDAEKEFVEIFNNIDKLTELAVANLQSQ